MTVTSKCIIEPVQATVAEVTYYTAPANTRTTIDKFTGTNTTAGAVTLTVKLVPSGGSAATSNTITSARSLAAGEAYGFPELVGHVLNAGDFISVIAGAGASIVIRASGREIV